MFPDEAMNLAVELKLGDTWVDIKKLGHVYTRDPITITRGRQDEGSRADPSTCSMTLDNRDGRYCPRNVLGPYYGLIGRNTPIRVSAGAGDVGVYLAPGAAGGATTPDTAVLDITGDLDVRVDAAVRWRGDSGGLAGKYVEPGNQRAWILWLDSDGSLILYWSTTGGNLSSARSAAAVPAESGRLAIRATIDVDNGAAGRTVTFYTAPGITGPWTQLGAPVVQAGTTSIFNSSAPLQVGGVLDPVVGRGYAAEVRSGIGGTVVASPVFSAQVENATGFTDGAGRVWTVTGAAQITNRTTRFVGEVPSWPIRWGPSEQDGYVRIEAAGILRRLGQGRKPLQSAIRRAIAGSIARIRGIWGEDETPIVAYWPMEDGPGATQAAPAVIPGVAPLRALGSVAFTDEASGGTSGGATFGDGGRLVGATPGVPNVVGGIGAWMIIFWLDLPADMGADGVSPIVQWRTPGSPIATRWDLYTGQSIGGVLFLEAADDNNNIVISAGGTTDLRGRGPVQVSIEHNNNGTLSAGANVRVNAGSPEISVSVVGDQTSTPTSIGVNLSVAAGTDFSGSVSHLIVAPNESWQQGLASSLVPAGLGYRGETAGARFERLTAEEGIPAALTGDADDTEPMGPQLPAPILELLADGEDADGGTGYEARDELALRYRARAADYNTPAALILDYHDQVAYPLEPVDDDQNTRNDVTVERQGGSSARVVIDAGPLSTQAPPDGVGTYDESLTLNVADDSQLLPIAGWRAHLGTVDEARYPVVRVKLHKHPDLIDAVTATDVRSRIHLTNLPPWEPPGTVDLIADGYTEVLEPRRWTIEYNTVPGSPWRTGVLDDDTLGRADTDGSVLVAAVDADDTALLVASTGGPYWTTDPAETPFDVRLGGEVVTVTAVADGVTDLFDRTTSNGWGTTPDGQAWTVHGTASWASTGSGIGQLAIPSAGAGISMGLAQVCPGTVDVEATLRTTVVTAGSVVFYQLLAFYDQAAGNAYVLRVGFDADGIMRIGLETGLSVVEQLSPGVTIGPYTANTWYRARLRIQGGLLQGRVWTDGTREPAAWHLSAFDTRFTSGDVGMQIFVAGGNSNPKPFLAQWGELIVHNPQRLTVARAVNGISKPQLAGADIRLAQPSIIAL